MPEAMLCLKLQHCKQHIAQNIKKKLTIKKYLIEEYKIIMNFVWFYIQSLLKIKLDKNRIILLKSLKNNEQTYIRKYWCFYESQFIHCFTKKDLNLGCNSTQHADIVRMEIRSEWIAFCCLLLENYIAIQIYLKRIDVPKILQISCICLERAEPIQNKQYLVGNKCICCLMQWIFGIKNSRQK